MRISRTQRFLAAVTLSMTLLVIPAFACELAGPNTHIGKIKAIELAQSSLTIIDQQMKKDVTFQAAQEQLKGLSVGQRVSVKYSEMKGQLRAEEIKPL
jgi:cold shock CspA family protein